ncbi:MAG: bifunctional precorrin-2 dehydrogenase/sirohydrochlorin ferrochelatase [Desulfovibrio sp.]|nr:bifunctional precorrin-2 dehydrogenase/sirohydrochlorin ferrochelatase [Desulfovibrio sp.]
MQEPTKHFYHIAISLADRICLIAGLGRVGKRKLAGLLALGTEAPERILLFEPRPDEPLRALLRDHPRLILFERSPTPLDLLRATLIFACTGNLSLNRDIALFCREHSILCNCTSDPELGDVEIPAQVDLDPMVLTLSTGGASPALARVWKEELRKWGEGKRPMLLLMRRLRPLVLARKAPQEENQKLFRALAESALETLLANAEQEKAWQLLHSLLPDPMKKQAKPLIEELFGTNAIPVRQSRKH